jgi:hypothetical protein
LPASDAKLFATRGAAYRLSFGIRDDLNALVAGAADLDSEISKDGGAFVDCTNEAVEVEQGVYHLDLTATEMDADAVAVIIKTSTVNAKTTSATIYPLEVGDIRANVVQVSGSPLVVTPPPPTATLSFVLVDANTNADLLTVNGGETYVLQSGQNVVLEARATGPVSSTQWDIDGNLDVRIDNTPPFRSHATSWPNPIGARSVNVDGWSGQNATGVILVSKSVSFTVQAISTSFRVYINVANRAGIPNFDSLHPDLYGFARTGTPKDLIDMVYQATLGLQGCNQDTVPSQSAVQNGLVNFYGAGFPGKIELDVECWPTNTQNTTRRTHRVNVMNWAKQAQPDAQIGYYATLPTQVHFSVPNQPNYKTTASYQTWLSNNQFYQPVYNLVDFFRPNCYARTNNVTTHNNYCNGLVDMINTIGRAGRTILLYLNPRYGFGARDGSGNDIAFDNISQADFLSFLNNLSSTTNKNFGVAGVVIWMEGPWSNFVNRPWWQAVQQFLGFSA